MVGPLLGLFDQKLAQQFGHGVVDELAAVVGMKAANHKRKLCRHRFEQWNQPQLRDLRCGSNNLPLCHLVHRVDVVDALAAILIALVHGVDAQVSGQALGLRLAPFANGESPWVAFCETLKDSGVSIWSVEVFTNISSQRN